MAKEAIPGVVVVTNSSGVCTGAVLKTFDVAGARFAYVLTAKHCVWSTRNPSVGMTDADGSSRFIPARVVAASPATFTDRLLDVPFGGTVEWSDDWAIVEVPTATSVTALPLFPGDPEKEIPSGADVVLQSYFDEAYPPEESSGRRKIVARAHEHRFRWTGRPAEIAQQGHSGAPVLHEGRLFAMLVGATENAHGSQLITGRTWLTRIWFVSIAAIRSRAAELGVRLD